MLHSLGRMSVFCSTAVLACSVGAGSSVLALDLDAQIKLGEAEYIGQCASCHGLDGKGGGPAAEALSTPPSDLTAIAAKFGGTFPDDHIYAVIDGREKITPHGDRDMPVWGLRYWQMAAERSQEVHLDVDSAALVHGRISALVTYLKSIQAE